MVMRNGERWRRADARRVFDAPEHPYTRALLAAVPVLGSLARQALPMPFPEDGRQRAAGDGASRQAAGARIKGLARRASISGAGFVLPVASMRSSR